MRLFAFGLGYCARAAIARGRGVEASGTVRSAEAAVALRREGIEAFAFDGARFDPALLEALGIAANLSPTRLNGLANLHARIVAFARQHLNE